MNTQTIKISFTCLALLASAACLRAGTITKANNTDNLNLASSWVGGLVPGALDVAKWDSTVTGANSVALGADISLGGIIINNPGGAVMITAGNTLSIGTSGITNASTGLLTIGTRIQQANTTLNEIVLAAQTAGITLNGLISNNVNPLRLTFTGSGSQSILLASANTFSGGVTINSVQVPIRANSTPTSGTVTSGPLGTGTVTLNNGGILFASGAGYAIGNPIVMGPGGGTLQNSNASPDLTINGNITGSGPLTLAGVYNVNGLFLNGDDSAYNGTVTVIGSNNRLGKSASGSALARWVVNGALQAQFLGGTNYYLGELSSTGTGGSLVGHAVNPNPAIQNFVVGALNTSSTFSGIIADNAANNAQTGNQDAAANNLVALTKVGTGTLTLSGANTHNGGTTISAGTLALSGTGTLGASANALKISGGTLDLGGLPPPAAAGAVTISGGTIQNGTLTASTSYTANNTGSAAVSANLAGTVALTKSGAGTLTLSGANTYSGGTTISAGTLALSGTGTLGAAVNALSISGGTLDLGGLTSPTAGAVTISGGTIQNGTLTASTSYTGNNNGPAAVSAILAGPAAVTKSGAGTLTLSGVNTYSGSTTVNAGKLVVSSTQTSVGAASVANGATLGITASGTTQWSPSSLTLGTSSGATTLEFNNIQNPGTTTAPLNPVAATMNNGTVTVKITSISSPTTHSSYPLLGNQGGTTTGYVLGTQPLGVTGHLAVSGTTLVYIVDTLADIWNAAPPGGFWDVATTPNWTANAVNNSPVNTFLNGDTILFNDSVAGPQTVTVTAAVTPAIIYVANNTTTDNSATAYTITDTTGSIGGSTALNKSGNGSLTLSGQNTYSGGTTLSAGQLNINHGGSSSANSAIGTGTLTISDGTIVDNTGSGDVTLLPNNAQNWNGDFTYAGSAHSLNLGTGAVTPNGNRQVAVSANTLTVGGSIGGGAISLTKAGAGTLTLAGANTYSGGTTISAGTLQLGGSLSTSGMITDNGNLTINRNNAVVQGTDFSGSAITGSGSFTQAGSGTTTLTAANTYSGATTVSAGTLLVNGSTASGSAVSVASGATLGGNGTVNGPVTVNSGGTLSAGASIGTLTISNSLNFAAGSTNYVEVNATTGTNDRMRGLTSVTYGGTLAVANLSGTLTTGNSFKLFDSAAYSGAFTAISPSTPGAGLVWDTSSLINNGTLKITVGATGPPDFTSIAMAGGNVILAGTNGPLSGNFLVLTSANLFLPRSNWGVFSSRQFDGGGHFNLTNAVNPAEPYLFFIIHDTTVPTPIISLAATAGNIQVSLSWTASAGATSYNVKRATTSGGPYTMIANVTATSFVNTGLANGTTYYYVVSALNANGESANSSQASATPNGPPPPAAPIGLAATAGDTQVLLGWTASAGAMSYNVKRATTSGGPYTTITNVTATSFLNTGLTNGTTYYYVVSALNASGEGANSSEASATPALPPPPVPIKLTAAAGNAQVLLSWTASAGATSYNVKRATTSGGPYTTITNVTTTSLLDTGLVNGTRYYYAVSALNATGESANSSQAFATPSATPPPLVYSVENTGANCAAPPFPTLGNLPFIQPFPDPFCWANDPLNINGTRSTDFPDWKCHRAEHQAQIEHYEIGPKPTVASANITAAYANGTLTVVVTRPVSEGPPNSSRSLTLTCPVSVPSGTGPFPAIIAMTLAGGANTGSLPSDLFSNCVQIAYLHNQTTEYAAGQQVSHAGDPFFLMYPEYTNSGQYSAWAWGVSRIIDGLYAVTNQITNSLPVDLQHISVTGCSYAGKMALFSGAMDERVALTIAQESGGGGATSWRYSHTEPAGSVESLENTDRSWFSPSMFQFGGNNVSYLPEDHHELTAMCAPRALYLTGNTDFVWLSNPSCYVNGRATAEIYKTLGVPDRFGFSIDGGHGHCSFPNEQRPELYNFVQKFLWGNTNLDTTITTHPASFDSIDYARWYQWWGTTNAVLP